jgi:N-acetylglucosaminyldiphosphoundecaprenol N-acetyl-beta-D-mannosaminyltransferase
MGVGGGFDQIVDPTLQPPAYIDSIGLGWLYRLLREPWRWKRQLALVRFAGMVLRVFLRRIRSFSRSA